MNYRKNRLERLGKASLAGLGIFSLTSIIGCGSSPQPMDTDYMNKQVDRSKVMREIFDRNHGDASAMSAADRETMLKQNANDQKEVDRMWDQMAHPPGGAPVQQISK